MAAKGGKDDDHNYELENEILRRRIQTLEKLIALKEEQTAASQKAAASLSREILGLVGAFEEEERQIFKNIAALTARSMEIKTHHQQLVENLQKQLEKAQTDVAVAEADVVATREAKETDLQRAKEALKRLEDDLSKMTSDFADLLSDTAERVLERISMSHGSWSAEQKRRPLESRLSEEPPLPLGIGSQASTQPVALSR